MSEYSQNDISKHFQEKKCVKANVNYVLSNVILEFQFKN